MCFYNLETDTNEMASIEVPEEEKQNLIEKIENWRENTIFQFDQDYKGEQLLYAFYFKVELDKVQETGERSIAQGMHPHYRIKVLKDIGPNMKIGLLYAYNIHKQDWERLTEMNIRDDSLFRARHEGLGKSHFVYVENSGVWKVDGLDVDEDSATIQISKT